MQIAKINILPYINFTGVARSQRKQADCPSPNSFIQHPDTFERQTFIKTKGKFRDLAGTRTIHCPYCGLPMLSLKDFYDMKNRGVFSGNIKDFVNEVQPYKETLKPGNKEVFEIIEQYAKDAPQTNLSRVIRLMYKDSLKNLRRSQKPIFMEFVRTAYDLPEDRKPKFREFLELQRYKLLEIPHNEKFNSDDFQYKIKRMTETMSNGNNKSMLINLAESINHSSFENPNEEIPEYILKKIFTSKPTSDKCRKLVMAIQSQRKKVQLENNSLPIIILSSSNDKGLRQAFIRNMAEAIQNPNFKADRFGITKEYAANIAKLDPNDKLAAHNLIKKDIQLFVINKIQQIGEKLDRDDIKYLCKISKNMLLEKPIVMQFSNKAFQMDLIKELEGMEKTEIYYKLTDIAKKLPDSASNKNSFIAKHHLADSETIGYNLLRPSVATIEHIKPSHDGGINAMGNWALACERDNNKRMHTKLSEFLKKFAKDNPQKYFDEIIKAAKDGEIDPFDIIKQAKVFLSEGDVHIDTSELKKLLLQFVKV